MGAAADIARRGLFRALSCVRRERIEIAEADARFAFGPAGAPLRTRIEVLDTRAYSWLLRGSTGLAEGYVEGLWRTDDLVALNRIACRNLPRWDALRRQLHPLVGPVQRAVDLVPRNDRAGARANISAHYDLGNDLFEAFLDERLMYSCAVFEGPHSTLEDAQLLKLERVCEAL